MFHIHLAGQRGSSYSISLISQWMALALARRGDVRVTFSDPPDAGQLSSAGLFPPQHAAVLDNLPDLAPGEVPDIEVRMFSHYSDPGPGDHPKLLYVFAEARGPLVLERLPPRDVFEQSRNLGLLMPCLWVRRSFAEQGIAPDRMYDLGVGIDMATYAPSPEFRGTIRQQLSIDGLAIMNVSGMWGTKGIGELLRAADALLERGLRIHLILKGNDKIYSSKALLNKALRELPAERQKLVARHISYIGREMSMAEMAALYNAADVYASPYWAEGFNMPVLEAMSCGLPVIVTKGGSTDDFTSPAVARYISSEQVMADIGALLRPSAESLAQHLAAVYADLDFRRAVKRDGPAHVAASHTWDIKAAELVAIARDWSAKVKGAG